MCPDFPKLMYETIGVTGSCLWQETAAAIDDLTPDLPQYLT
jgi:hypothetical protein